jgi:hypothetical protein
VTEILGGDNEMIFEYSFSEPLSGKTDNFDLLEITGLELLEQVGAPIVPVRSVKILVPYGKEVVNCTVAAQACSNCRAPCLAARQKPPADSRKMETPMRRLCGSSLWRKIF